ncbi:MAG: hypothetical protein EBZ78_08870 [Verrucomicrobia bacterium]|nr:hypothetical protein [Verrucomicrobiota bacterium]
MEAEPIKHPVRRQEDFRAVWVATRERWDSQPQVVQGDRLPSFSVEPIPWRWQEEVEEVVGMTVTR